MRWSLPMVSFLPSNLTSPWSRGEGSRIGAMLIHLGFKAAPGWCPLTGKWNGQMGLRLARAIGNQKLMCPHLYRCLSPPWQPRVIQVKETKALWPHNVHNSLMGHLIQDAVTAPLENRVRGHLVCTQVGEPCNYNGCIPAKEKAKAVILFRLANVVVLE